MAGRNQDKIITDFLDLCYPSLPPDHMEAVEDAVRVLKETRAGPSGHRSDCAVHNRPAYPNGPCTCGHWEKENDHA